jgi:uncharacterized protein YeaO (DUF488 family)
MIKVKSVYVKAAAGDGQRLLVDRFWPEGLKTRDARVDQWLQELGPSYDLQRFHFNPTNWENYRLMYLEELLTARIKKKKLRELADLSLNNTITLLYGNHDPLHNHANVVKEAIEKKLFG